ncbi:hypothetical protein [Pseudomonas putida]|jgi:hypothetical protein|uniref:hypothetical protein n=1 Tax=Pseudomonas putida TaxID=303 RepID=UPI000CD3F62F|nr:hypothetical protein [Pseudomonas putida]POG00123.1 hypothetical protein BGP83_23605 [Pseudomonas putida]
MFEDHIANGAPLLNEAREARNKLALIGGHERLLAKLDDLLNRSMGYPLHGAEQAKMRNLIKQVNAL